MLTRTELGNTRLKIKKGKKFFSRVDDFEDPTGDNSKLTVAKGSGERHHGPYSGESRR